MTEDQSIIRCRNRMLREAIQRFEAALADNGFTEADGRAIFVTSGDPRYMYLAFAVDLKINQLKRWGFKGWDEYNRSGS